MSPDALPIHARDLLEHQEFVRALSKSLLRDEHAAQDVAQDTWLTLLTHPPRTMDSLRGWLAQVARNRVRNAAREAERRVGREARVARHEADESTEGLHERLEMQHRVVEAVLALREPYRTVIVLAYYDGASTATIAERMKSAPGTVRAQLSRAHEMLRQKLDAHFGGDRNAWSIALAASSLQSSSRIAGVKLGGWAAAVAALLGTGVVAWVWIARGASVEPASTSRVASLARPIAAGEPSSSGEARIAKEAIPLETEASAVVSPRREVATPATSELDDMLTDAKQIQLVLRERLLTPDPALVALRADVRVSPDVRFARLWQRGALGADMNNLVGLRGAGSFLSFATGIQDYDHEPDIALDQVFQSGFYGGTVGLVVRLDATKLGDVVDERSVRPSSVGPETWGTLWQESNVDERSIPAVYEERIRKAAQSTQAVVGLGVSYLVRSVMAGEHDLVAAFEVIGRDDKSATIAWRVLKLWDTPRHEQTPRPDPVARIPAPPDSLRNLSTEELTQRHRTISQRAQHMILDLPKDLDPAWARFANLTNGGLARIAERSRWDSLLSVDGGGAYWSFTSRSNDYQHDAQIELQQARFSSGFAGHDRGYVLDLGESPLDQVTLGGPPHGSTARVQEAYVFMRDLEPVPMSDARSDLEISEADNERAASLGLIRGARAVVGHSYLVRSVITDRVDVLAAFQVLARDEMALTTAWKILRQKPASR